MLKKITTVLAIVTGTIVFSQVGIATPDPKATLDVAGKPMDANTFDGIIAPRITGTQLRIKSYTTDQTGALVYVTEADTAPAGQTIDVTAPGYYYFNGIKWLNVEGITSNIYTADGSLTGSGTKRYLTLNGKELNFTGTQQRTYWSANGSMNQSNLQSSGVASVSLYGGNDSNLFLQQFYNSSAQVIISGNSKSFILGSNATAVSAPIILSTSSGSGAGGTEKMRITGEGNVGVNTSIPTEKFHVNGNIRFQNLPLNGTTNAIYTMSDGSASTTKNQSFTATGTIVTDANGVLGYVNYVPNNLNIYNGDGSLTGDRLLNQSGRILKFDNGTTGQSTTFNNSAGTGIIQRPGSLGNRASIGLYDTGGSAALWIYSDSNSSSQMLATNNSSALSIGTNSTVAAAPLRFTTSSGSSATGVIRAEIAGDGRFNVVNSLSVGYPSQQTFSSNEKLKVNGSIVTAAGGFYPDYVFEDYLDGYSSLNSKYKFKSIYETEKYIKEKRHLPGVTPITALEKTEDGKHMINLSDLSVQSLEKIEELYLHIIEQQKQIDALTATIKDMQKKLDK